MQGNSTCPVRKRPTPPYASATAFPPVSRATPLMEVILRWLRISAVKDLRCAFLTLGAAVKAAATWIYSAGQKTWQQLSTISGDWKKLTKLIWHWSVSAAELPSPYTRPHKIREYPTLPPVPHLPRLTYSTKLTTLSRLSATSAA